MPCDIPPVFPAIRELANRASILAQKRYVYLNATQLALLSTTALCAGLNPVSQARQRLVAYSVCFLMFIGLMVWVALQIGRFEVRWFKCRAFAENSKSIVWRFVMSDLNIPRERELVFLDEWRELRGRLPELQSEFALCASGNLVTPWMHQVVNLSLQEKVQCYRKYRLQNQLDWYSANSSKNSFQRTIWFWSLFLTQCVIILVAALQAWLLIKVNLVGFIASAAVGMLAWSQLKRFSDLATTYAVTVEDLSRISSKYSNVETQEDLNALVSDVEDAVSREHSIWLARRVVC